MQKLAFVLLLACISSASAAWLYTADAYNLNFNLYAIDTDTFTTRLIGQITDADGDKYTINAMHYLESTGLIYALGNKRASNSTKMGGILAINPTNAQVVWHQRCLDSPVGDRFNSMAFDSTRDQFIINPTDDALDSRNITFLSRANMIAGNCSALRLRFPSPSFPYRNYYRNGAHYLPQLDVMVTGRDSQQASDDYYFIHLNGNTTTAPVIDHVQIGTNSWTGLSYGAGDYASTADGALWQVNRGYGPAHSILIRIDFGTNLTQLITGERSINITRPSEMMIIPRALGGLTEGPAPAAAVSEWTTKYAGAALLVNDYNQLWEVNLAAPRARKVADLTSQVIAMESFGTWDSVFAIVNGTNGVSMARVNVTNGALTNVAALPALYTSLTRSADGRLVAFRNLNDTHSEVAIVNANGGVSSIVTIPCTPGNCRKVLLDADLAIAAVNGINVRFANFTHPDNISRNGQTFDAVNDCPETPDTEYGCTGWWEPFQPDSVGDWTSIGNNAAIVNVNHLNSSTGIAGTSFFRMNMTTGRADIIVDLPNPFRTFEFAHFQYNRAWCSNQGNWVAYRCVCDNAGIVGARCETTLPAPVSPPMAPPVVAPVATPVASPVAAPVAKAPTAGAKAPVVSAASSNGVAVLIIALSTILLHMF